MKEVVKISLRSANARACEPSAGGSRRKDKFKDFLGYLLRPTCSPTPSVTRSIHFLILFLCFWLKLKLLEIAKKSQ